MWNGKNKAITFSFDDGVTQDEKLIKILDDYGLKSTFNINSEMFGEKNVLNIDGKVVNHNRLSREKIAELYKNHEVASHTLTHPGLTLLDNEQVIYQVAQDQKNLELLTNKTVRVFAYPFGAYNDKVAKLISENTDIKLARTVESTYSFDMQNDLMRFNPTLSFCDPKMFELGKKFIELQTDTPQLFYIWGHAYELDSNRITWNKFEEFCKMISGKADIFYGTNSQIFF